MAKVEEEKVKVFQVVEKDKHEKVFQPIGKPVQRVAKNIKPLVKVLIFSY